VVEEDSVAGEHAVSLAVVDHHPVGVKLGNTIWRSDLKNEKNLYSLAHFYSNNYNLIK
jgi:hypothetical protein